MFADCMEGRHGNQCKTEFERYEIITRRGKTTFSYTGEFVKCNCTCHRK